MTCKEDAGCKVHPLRAQLLTALAIPAISPIAHRRDWKWLSMVAACLRRQVQSRAEAAFHHRNIRRFQASGPAACKERIHIILIGLELHICLIDRFVRKPFDLVAYVRVFNHSVLAGQKSVIGVEGRIQQVEPVQFLEESGIEQIIGRNWLVWVLALDRLKARNRAVVAPASQLLSEHRTVLYPCGRGVRQVIFAGRRISWGPDHVREYQVHLFRDQKLSPRTIEGQAAALRFLFVKTLRRAYLPDAIPFPKRHKRLPTVLSQGEVARLIDSTGNLMHRAMVMTLYATGVRRAELCR